MAIMVGLLVLVNCLVKPFDWYGPSSLSRLGARTHIDFFLKNSMKKGIFDVQLA